MACSILRRKFALARSKGFYQQIRTGYIVLLPETGPPQGDKNPLFKNGLPDAENLSGEKCLSTLGNQLLDFEHCIREVENSIIENKDELDLFENVLEPIEESGSKMEATWGLSKVLYLTESNFMPPQKYVLMHNRARKARSAKFNSKPIYNMFKNCDKNNLTEEEQRVVNKFQIEGKLNGLDLPPEKKEYLSLLLVGLANEKEKFLTSTQATTRNFRHTIHDPVKVSNFPDRLLYSMAQDKAKYKNGPWDILLNPSITDGVLAYCSDRDVRWNTWMALRQVASGLSGQSDEFNNSFRLEKIRSLRRDIAAVLGYESYIHMSMETKMAGSLDVVKSTLYRLLEKAKMLQEKELTKLQEFAYDRGFRGSMEMWDITYWEREQKQDLYQWDNMKISEYFPLETVFKGILNLTSRTFGIRFEEEKKVKSWHPDIKLYHIFNNESPNPIAGLYIDFYSRDGKMDTGTGSGHVVGIRPVAKILGTSQPLAAMIFNFPPPKSNKEPCLLHFDDVENMFKKFGQALQQLLSHVNYSEVSGLSNIEWDAVEVVSNFMYLWLKDTEVLKEISGHYRDGKPLPFNKIEQIRKHMAGYRLCQEIYLANLDLDLHTSKEFWLPLMKKLWQEHFILPLDSKDNHPLSFTASVCGDLSGAYYSRLWARMLAEDAYNSFKTDPDRAAIGLRFRDTFLGFGGACHPSEVFRRFQGRDPSPEAFEDQLNDN